MRAAAVVVDILRASASTKRELCTTSGVSRSLLDDYLKGRRQPSLAQLERLAAAAGYDLDVTIRPRRTVSPELVAVLEFGDLFPRKEKAPLIDLGPVWRSSVEA